MSINTRRKKQHGTRIAHNKSKITVKSEVFARILFSRIALKAIFKLPRQNSRLGHGLPASINDSDFDISQGYYFHETSHLQMRSFVKIIPSQKFPNLQYATEHRKLVQLS